ncbi:hypothetical protein SDC9_182930 [bioreactor metagenome]|uniref:Uncharacterized protein n=1 Tax=bioreactor metagenome TaxID=1076179 RepID=A0A645HAP4_9ZZZZ
MLLGFKKKWKIDVIAKLNVGQSYQACLGRMIDRLQEEKKQVEYKIHLCINEFVSSLNLIDNNYKQK